MTKQEADKAILEIGRGLWKSDSSSLGTESSSNRVLISPGLTMILTYNHPHDLDGNLRQNDHLASTAVCRFSDLCPGLPAEDIAALRLVHDSPSVSSGGLYFNSCDLIHSVNGLFPLGKERALQVMRQYMLLGDRDYTLKWRYNLDEQRIFLILRLLFVRSDGDARMPWMYIGGTCPQVEVGHPDWPLFPLVLSDDMPMVMIDGYELFGHAEEPAVHIDYCGEKCVLRSKPLSPVHSPIVTVNTIVKSRQWKKLFNGEQEKYQNGTLDLLRQEAITSLHGLIENDPKVNSCCIGIDEADANWKRLVAQPALSNAPWDAQLGRFVTGK